MSGKLTIVGLGPGGREHLTLAVYQEMKRHNNIFLRTEKHPIVDYLREEGILFKTFDDVYEEFESFQGVYDHIVQRILAELEKGDVLYGVPGHPYVAETTVQLLIEGCRNRGIDRIVYPAMSFVDAMFMALEVDPVEGFLLLDGLQLDKRKPDPNIGNIITQVYDPFIASQVKLELMHHYDDEQPIFVVRAAGVPGEEKIAKIPLYELDHLRWIDYLTTIFIPKVDNEEKKYYNMNNLVEIMERLRSKEGCPWDQEQTHESLKPYLIEESYEVLEAIDEKDDFSLEEELGDLLLQVVFHSEIAKERGAFQIEDVIRGISQKLVFRHPHVFKEMKADNTEEALQNWEEQKRQEKELKSYTQSMMSIPKHLPALMKAIKIQKKARNVGFDWEKVEDVLPKVEEELQELMEAFERNDEKEVFTESGDLIFAVVNLLRFLKVDPEEALNSANQKFIRRFQYVEEETLKLGKNLKDMKLEEMDKLWNQSKQHF